MVKRRSHSICIALAAIWGVTLVFAAELDLDTNSIQLQSTEFRQAVSIRLTQEGVWFAQEGEVVLRYRRKDSDRVRGIMADVANDFLPIGHSASYVPSLQTIFKQKLQEAGISYREQKHGDELWIVWSEEDNPRVTEIQVWLQEQLMENPQLLDSP